MYIAFFPSSEVEELQKCSNDKDAMRFLDKLDDCRLYNMDDVNNVHQFVIDNNSGVLSDMLSFSFDFNKEGYESLMAEIVAEDEEEKRQIIEGLAFLGGLIFGKYGIDCL